MRIANTTSHWQRALSTKGFSNFISSRPLGWDYPWVKTIVMTSLTSISETSLFRRKAWLLRMRPLRINNRTRDGIEIVLFFGHAHRSSERQHRPVYRRRHITNRRSGGSEGFQNHRRRHSILSQQTTHRLQRHPSHQRRPNFHARRALLRHDLTFAEVLQDGVLGRLATRAVGSADPMDSRLNFSHLSALIKSSIT